MRRRWERVLATYDEEKPRLQEQLRVAREQRERERQELIDLSDAAEAQRLADEERRRVLEAERQARLAEQQAQHQRENRAASVNVGAGSTTRGASYDRTIPQPIAPDPMVDPFTRDPSTGPYRQPSYPPPPRTAAPPRQQPPPGYDPGQLEPPT